MTAHASSEHGFSHAELIRYSRHIALPQVGIEGQCKLKTASVVVVGTGGLGSPVSMYLAAAGIGRLGIVDFDVVDSSNLQRQIVHSEQAIGTAKVESAAKRLRSLNSSIAIDCYPAALTNQNALDILQPYDIIVDGTDNFATRYLLNDAAIILGKTLVYGSIYRFEGQVSVFGKDEGPCYRCLLPTPPPPHLVPTCAQAGVMGIVPGTIGTLQATEVLKLILGVGEPLVGKLLLYDALSTSFEIINIPKRTDCPACGAAPTITELIDYEGFCGMPVQPESGFHGPANIVNLSPREINARLDASEELVLLDIREPFEMMLSRLGNAIHIPMSQIGSRWQEIPRDKPVIVFCHMGVRSVHLIGQLQATGFTNLINMNGGIDAWSQQVDPSIPRY